VSHGPSSEGSTSEPNLTPLLDVVLQLLMFFMMCVNFVTEQVNKDIHLPVSASAVPMDKGETDVLFINLKPFRPSEWGHKGPDQLLSLRRQYSETPPERQVLCAIVLGKADPLNSSDLRLWLKESYERERQRLILEKKADPKVNTTIIIRADKDLEYALVFQAMKACEDAGYARLKLRALTKSGVIKS
jgi:biopolymer transport protein ExbD